MPSSWADRVTPGYWDLSTRTCGGDLTACDVLPRPRGRAWPNRTLNGALGLTKKLERRDRPEFTIGIAKRALSLSPPKEESECSQSGLPVAV